MSVQLEWRAGEVVCGDCGCGDVFVRGWGTDLAVHVALECRGCGARDPF